MICFHKRKSLFIKQQASSTINSVVILAYLLLSSAPSFAGILATDTISNKNVILTTDTIGGIEVEIRRADNGGHPLVIFSHGMGVCPNSVDGIQSRLARAGYTVIAPKHADCISGSTTPDVSWRKPQKWTDKTHSNRRDDMHRVLDALPSSDYAQYIKSFDQIGCMGHSMGGYTCMGLAGAWDSWKRDEITSIALLSPWHKPYMVQDRISNMTNVTTLYQGGSKDRSITPDLIEPNGAFDQTLPAKYLQIFKRAKHSSWTDRALAKRFHDQMSYYIVSFFDAALKQGSEEKLEVKRSQTKELMIDY
jgi:dienelactone hydrolase